MQPSSLSDLKNRSEKVTGREQILTILKANSYSIGRKSDEIWAGQTLLQPISFESDRLPGIHATQGKDNPFPLMVLVRTGTADPLSREPDIMDSSVQ
jgi:hypothetical protein